jgi:hypothetical protein
MKYHMVTFVGLDLEAIVIGYDDESAATNAALTALTPAERSMVTGTSVETVDQPSVIFRELEPEDGDDQAWDRNAEALTAAALGTDRGTINPNATSVDDIFSHEFDNLSDKELASVIAGSIDNHPKTLHGAFGRMVSELDRRINRS